MKTTRMNDMSKSAKICLLTNGEEIFKFLIVQKKQKIVTPNPIFPLMVTRKLPLCFPLVKMNGVARARFGMRNNILII